MTPEHRRLRASDDRRNDAVDRGRNMRSLRVRNRGRGRVASTGERGREANHEEASC